MQNGKVDSSRFPCVLRLGQAGDTWVWLMARVWGQTMGEKRQLQPTSFCLILPERQE